MVLKAKVKINRDFSSKVRGFGSITIDNAITFSGVNVIEGKNGPFVSMPRYQAKDGTFKDSVIPLKKNIRFAISQKVLKEYEDELFIDPIITD